MREFRVRMEGWRVWEVPRAATGLLGFADEYRDGWLCFEAVESGSRWRLPATQAPPDWAELSDIRLRQLLIVAREAKTSGVTTRAVSQRRREVEDAASGTADVVAPLDQ